MSVLSNESSSHYRCAEATLPFSAVARRLSIRGKILTLGVGEFTVVVVGFPWFLRGRMWELRLFFWFWELF